MAYSNSAHPNSIKPSSSASYDQNRCNDTHRSNSDVTDPSGIRAAAKLFIERFGADAQNQARIRAEELLQAGNIQSRTRWQLIGKEVENLLKNKENLQKTSLN